MTKSESQHQEMLVTDEAKALQVHLFRRQDGGSVTLRATLTEGKVAIGRRSTAFQCRVGKPDVISVGEYVPNKPSRFHSVQIVGSEHELVEAVRDRLAGFRTSEHVSAHADGILRRTREFIRTGAVRGWR